MLLNVKARLEEKTYEGAPAYSTGQIGPEAALRRSVLSCLLWEKTFYEDGMDIADRIIGLCARVSADTMANLAREARSQFNLRHAPLLLLCGLIKHGKGAMVGDAITDTIQRADEITELLAIYWRNGKCPLSKQLKRGLANAFRKFNEYQIAKYNRGNAIKLRNVMFLTHPRPDMADSADLYKRLANNTLATPDTWEVSLSAGANKKETFERLINEGKLGYLALLRNLRNMAKAGVDENLVGNALIERKGANRVLPFRYVAAARACKQWERWIDRALLMAIDEMEPLPGKTAVLIDVSESMEWHTTGRSGMTYMDAAAALGAIVPGNVRLFTFSNKIAEVPPRKGMAGVDAIINSQLHGGTYLGQAVRWINANVPCDRLIVITDEQSHDPVPGPKAKGYMINVSSNRNGVSYGPWVHMDGFSESVLRYIAEMERHA